MPVTTSLAAGSEDATVRGAADELRCAAPLMSHWSRGRG